MPKDLTSRDAILATPDLKVERHYIPEWEGYVYLRRISGTSRDRFEASLIQGEVMSTENIRAKLLVECLCDPEGNAIFTPEDVDALGAKSGAGLTRCYNHASKLNAISDVDVEQLAGNSDSEATATL